MQDQTARVLLVNMPFSSLRWPAIGISLLKSGLERRGLTCDTAYFNFDFAETIGLELYDWINDSFGFVLGGERVFAQSFFEGQLPDDPSYFRHVLLAADPGFNGADLVQYQSAVRFVEPFLEGCLRQTDWRQYAIVGFTTTFQQTVASLALARRLKLKHPRICIIFGGANCEGEMGQALLEQFPFIDLVFSGESDETFPIVVAQLLDGRLHNLPAGVLGRGLTAVAENTGPGSLPLLEPDVARTRRQLPRQNTPSLVDQLDELPYPDYADYFMRLQKSPLCNQLEPVLLFETSRGCWWGSKKQCTFCGLNGGRMVFRRKSPNRAVQELRHLREHYGVRRACATDNIMDFRYFNTFLPLLKQAQLDLELEYELKTNLTHEQVQSLVDAGLGAAQLGIETLSTPVLRLMRKGVSAVQNVQTLKWLTEADVEVKWNFLYGFPGEDPDDYGTLPELLRNLIHLAPPQAAGPIRIDRFSPYMESPEAFGLTGLTPATAYQYIYPLPRCEVARLAYYFETDQTKHATTPGYVQPVLDALRYWQAAFPTATLRQSEPARDTLVLLDTRPNAVQFQHRLTGLERELYMFCNSAQSWRSIAEFVRQRTRGPESRTRDQLDRWIADRIMVELDGNFLSLALRTPQRANSGDDSTVGQARSEGDFGLPPMGLTSQAGT